MYPWIIILLVAAGVVFGLDYLLRRKAWNANSKDEKISLLVHMFSGGPYIFLSILGALWGIVSYSPETALGEILYDATMIMGETYFVVASAATMISLVLRKKGKTKTSIWINVFALLYIVVVLTVNSLVGKLL